MVLGAQVAFALACTLTKLSMLMLVRRLLSSSTLFWRRVTLLGIIIVAVQGSVFCITVIFQCRYGLPGFTQRPPLTVLTFDLQAPSRLLEGY